MNGREFRECKDCSAKPGTPILCPKCLQRRKQSEVVDYLWGIFDYAYKHGFNVKAYKLPARYYKLYTDSCHNWNKPLFCGVEVRLKPDYIRLGHMTLYNRPRFGYPYRDGLPKSPQIASCPVTL